MPELLPKPRPKKDILTIDTSDFFRVKNVSDQTIELTYASKEAFIPPGESYIISFAALCMYYGDPRSRKGMVQKFRDSTGSGIIPERIAECQRLSVRYGVYEHGLDALAAKCPDVIITTLDDKEIIPPVFDPDGDLTSVNVQHDNQRSNDVATLLAEYGDKIKALEAQLEALNGSDNTDDDVEVDDPADSFGPR
jgi:hypothetical protein